MELNFEVLLLFVTTVMFTIGYLVSQEDNRRLILGSINIVCWFTLSFVYVASETTYPIVALIFMLVGIIQCVALIITASEMMKERRWGTTWR